MAKIDSENMRELLIEFPDQCKNAFDLVTSNVIESISTLPKNVAIIGMGGSAIGGDLVRNLLAEIFPIVISVHRNYQLPAFVDRNSLVFAVSYSGNTAETLQAVEISRDRGAEIIAITSGGKLKKFAEKHGYRSIIIPSGQQPRASIGYLSIPILATLDQFIPNFDLENDINEMIFLLNRNVKKFNDLDSFPMKLAKKLRGKLPIIYAPCELESVAIRFKTQICENAKAIAYHNVYPEMNHNEIEGWKHPPQLTKLCHVVQLFDPILPIETRKRMEITADLISENVDEITRIDSEGESLLARFFSLISIADWTSFYLSVLYDEDPTPVKKIEKLKELLK